MRKWFEGRARSGADANQSDDAANRDEIDETVASDEKRRRSEQMNADNEKTQANSPTVSGEAEAIRILSDVESRLHALKQMHENNSVLAAELSSREERVAESERELVEAQGQLDHARERVQEQTTEAATLQKELASEGEALAQQRRQVESKAQQANDEFEAACQLQQELDAKEQQFARKAEASTESERALDDQIARTEEAQTLAAERAAELLRVHEQISAASNEAESVRLELAESSEKEAELRDQLASSERRLEEGEAVACELETAKQRLADAEGQHAADLHEAQSARGRISEFERSNGEFEEQIASLEEQVARDAGRGQELDDAQQQLVSAREQIDASSSNAETTRLEMASATDESRMLAEKVSSLEQQLSSATASQQELDGVNQQLVDANARIESSERDAGQAVALQADLDRAVDGLAQLKARYETKISDANEVAASASTELESANEALRTERERLSVLERSAGEMQAHWDRRRARLASIRSSVHGKRNQVADAIVKLKGRQVECERVLKQRSDVERARKELRSKRREADKLIKRYKGAKFAMFLMVAAVLMMGMSWGVASHFIPATYQASATLSAENKDRDLASFEREEWLAYHEPMLADPQFHAMAAERFRRRGIASLGKAAEVTQFVSTNVHHRSNQAGELTIEVTGKGKERAELVLNTFVTAARSFAEAARSQRTDGASTIISQDAHVGDGPLNDPRPIYAGGIFMGGLVLMFGLGAPAWRRLNSASSEFDEQEKANEIGAESDWVEPELLQRNV